MSRTFSLVCQDLKLKIWVGQSGGSVEGMGSFYTGNPDVMQRLGRFLDFTRGHSLVLLDDDWDIDRQEDCEEFDEQGGTHD